MKTRIVALGALLVITGAGSALAQNIRETIDAAIDEHLVQARNAAGYDFTGTLARLCVAPPRFPLTIRDAAPAPAPARATWYMEPARVFDNLYFVGSKFTIHGPSQAVKESSSSIRFSPITRKRRSWGA